MGLLRPLFTIGGYTAISRVVGFVRDVMLAAVLGAGMLADTFLVAFKLPNFFRRLFGEGAFNSAFVPMFSRAYSGQGKKKAHAFAETIFAVMFYFLLAFTLVVMVAMPLVMVVLAPGFTNEPAQFDLAVTLTRITFPYLLCISLVAMMSGILNSLGKFAAAASAPIILNAAMLVALLGLHKYTQTPAHALAWSVAAAGVLQFIWLYVACKRAGLPLKLKKPKITPDVKRMLKLMVPGIVGAGVVQINLWVDIVIGTLIPGAISYLYYADRINQLPLGVIGVAVGTALLPMISKLVEQKKEKESVTRMNEAIGITMFLVLPAAVGAVVMAHPIISILFERGAFTAQDALATSYGLAAYALGLPAFVLLKVFLPAFFARHDTKTPVKVAVLCLIINIVLNLAFVFSFKAYGWYPHVGIALATSFAGWVNIIVLALVLRQRGQFALLVTTKKRLYKISLASAAMVLMLLLGMGVFPIFEETESWKRLVMFTITFTFGMVSYFACTYAFGAFSKAELKKLLRR